MAKDPIRSTLESLGLSEKETSLYLLLLQLGTSPASTLAGRADLPRSTAQFLCQQLVKRGLLRMIQKGNVYLFTPEPPEKLELLLLQQEEELQFKGQQLRRIMGDLKAMQNPYAILPKVQFYEGRDGILRAYRSIAESIESGGEILSYLHLLDDPEDRFQLTKELEKVTQTFRKKDVTNRVISPPSALAKAWQKEDDPPRRVTRILPDKTEISPVEIMIFGDSVFSNTVERNQIFGTLVTNAGITAMHRYAFEALWGRLG